MKWSTPSCRKSALKIPIWKRRRTRSSSRRATSPSAWRTAPWRSRGRCRKHGGTTRRTRPRRSVSTRRSKSRARAMPRARLQVIQVHRLTRAHRARPRTAANCRSGQGFLVRTFQVLQVLHRMVQVLQVLHRMLQVLQALHRMLQVLQVIQTRTCDVARHDTFRSDGGSRWVGSTYTRS
jgi:hypothetical protein